MKKIQKGMMCSLDPYNLMKQDVTSVTHVKIICRHKWRPFGLSIWKVQPVVPLKQEVLLCMEKLLYPDNMYIVRNPMDIPMINDNELEALNYMIEISKDINKEPLTTAIKRIKALKEKLEFYKSMKDV